MSNNSILKYVDFQPQAMYGVLKTRPQGLHAKEVKDRQERFGKNELITQKGRSAFSILLDQFKNPLIIILLLATLISGFLGEYTSAVIIIVMILMSAVLAFVQEYRSEKTLETLRNKVALKTTVIRDNKIKQINATELVKGDIVLLPSNSIVPADLRLIETNNLAINQSILSGEAFPVEKNAEFLSNCQQPLDAANLVFSGSHVVQGNGKGIVVAIGKETFLGQTAKLLEQQEPPSAFQKGISDFGYFLFRIIILFSLLVFLILALFRGNWLEALLFSLAIAVGISPELLPIIITINLSRGARKMAAKDVIVKRLMAIENLGNADVICTDKTGTLTEGKIKLENYFDFTEKQNLDVLRYANLCSSYTLKNELASNPLDKAIYEYARGKFKTNEGYKVLASIPFDFYRRRMSVVAEKNNQKFLICKGAAEELLSVCSYVKLNNRQEKLTDHLGKINKILKKFGDEGYRVILVAYKQLPKDQAYNVAAEDDLILSGLIVFSDPPKKSAAESIRTFKELGVSVKILTGDNELAAKKLCQDICHEYSRLLLGEQIDKMSDEKLKRVVYDVDVFAKVTPEHKLRIVKALKQAGHNVAFMGDGVNDAPALRAADVGISVDTAVDVAKEAADVILLKKSLHVLIGGVKEGRKTFGNTLKYILCTISSNYGNMFTVTGAALFLPFIPMLPVQVILLNFFSDFPMLAISGDEVDEEYLKKPKQWDIKKIKKAMNYFGLLSSVIDYVTFGFLIFILNAQMAVFQAGWFWESYLTEVLLIFVIRTKRWFWQSKPSRYLVGATLITTILVVIILFTGLRSYFGFGVLKIWQAGVIVALSFLYFAIVEFVKKFIYKKFNI